MSVKAETPTDWKREDVFATSAFSPILLQADIDIRSVFPNRDNDIIFTEMLQKIRKHQKKWVIGMPPKKKRKERKVFTYTYIFDYSIFKFVWFFFYQIVKIDPTVSTQDLEDSIPVYYIVLCSITVTIIHYHEKNVA